MVFIVSGYFVGDSQFAEVFPVEVPVIAKASCYDAGMNTDMMGEGFDATYVQFACEELFVCSWRD